MVNLWKLNIEWFLRVHFSDVKYLYERAISLLVRPFFFTSRNPHLSNLRQGCICRWFWSWFLKRIFKRLLCQEKNFLSDKLLNNYNLHEGRRPQRRMSPWGLKAIPNFSPSCRYIISLKKRPIARKLKVDSFH